LRGSTIQYFGSVYIAELQGILYTSVGVINPNPNPNLKVSKVWIRIQIMQKNKNNSEKSEVLEREQNVCFCSIEKLCFLFYRFQNTYENNESHFL
jgi:hypothetical protein